MNRLKPVTPGELLVEEFIIPMGLSQYRVAKEIGCRRSESVRSWPDAERLPPIPT